ncbi:MBL fold metallo-hydrolase [Pseudodonghicola flavimaris]|uniref:MBL fold metallo-hydrolase n=1 Tax=Pseudodonghicola flavimaris TaxID=3050036 RepID=A0ABT7F1C0_9RHOB|nr:MBL fold metallo-hydrolase [Pseudodonghicola flavimaris]MDK3018387.1 MBL fold metallo-hydrolase [Pseudodonghicola flavimaris]
MQPPDDFDPTHGVPETLSDGLRRLVAPNPSPMTYRGTNTYLVGTRELAVIDPGPMSEPHLEAILAALEPGQSISHIVVTHSHSDHSPLARPLAERTGARIHAFGGPEAGRSAVMDRIAATGLAGGGEGIDHGFIPDELLPDGGLIEGDGWALEVIHTPGHLGNHIALAMGDICFTADHVMGWATSLVSPPDGDLTDFMASCRRLRDRSWSVFHPGHGAPIATPAARLDWLIEHRLGREAQILEALSDGPATTAQLTRRVYTDVNPMLLPAAERNVFAHLVDLTGQNRVETGDALGIEAMFSRRS